MRPISSPHIPQLDALRFLAAFCVLAAHYATLLAIPDVAGGWAHRLGELTSVGMMLFFILSGVVIHLNYGESLARPGGVRRFWVARFARLYPLFFVLTVGQLAVAFLFQRSACASAGIPGGILLALPYHLTFTQSWFYTAICQSSLLFQYPLMSGITWSLSAEFFLYIAYATLLRRHFSQGLRRSVGIALAATALLAFYFWEIYLHRDAIDAAGRTAFGDIATVQHGYADSLQRWLLYFNPLIWLVPFSWGAAIAEWYKRRGPATQASAWQDSMMLVAAGITTWLYVVVILHIAPHNGAIGRIAEFFLLPSIAAGIALAMRFPASRIGRFLANGPMVKLGEASYSIYLLHPMLGPAIFFAKALGLPPAIHYGLGLIAVLAASRLCYVCFERPAQRWVRLRLTPNGIA